VVEEELLLRNLEILKNVQEESGAKILLAAEGVLHVPGYPLIAKYLCGTAASGLIRGATRARALPGEVHRILPPPTGRTN
jgi:carboxynorspermidine decarboxylase